jgi:hypothetical protein
VDALWDFETFRYEGHMTSPDDPNPSSTQRQKTEAELRQMRAAQKLRENLQRRKQQARARRAGEADMTDGLPAAQSDESCDG